MRVAIVGGGIIGQLTAYYLIRSGHEVHVYDKGDMADGCSYGNAGYLCPSHYVPLTAPGMIKQGLKWMFNSKSPLYFRFRPDINLLKWLWLFNKNATERHVARSGGPLTELALLSGNKYESLFNEGLNVDFQSSGILMVAQSAAELRHMHHTAKRARAVGLNPRMLTRDEISRDYGYMSVNCEGGVIYPEDGMLDPHKLMSGLKSIVTGLGAELYPNHEIIGLERSEGQITSLKTGSGRIDVDAVVIASGVWSASILRHVGCFAPLEAGKGYHIFCEQNFGIDKPIILEDAKVAITPLGNGVQFAGTMEIAGINHKINSNRIEGIQDAVTKYFPDVKRSDLEKGKVWTGLRPLSPDGLAYIGRVKPYSNLYVGAGHGMLGISHGAGTAYLLDQMINGHSAPDWLNAYDPNRFSRKTR